MSKSNKKYLFALIIFLFFIVIPCISAAETIQYLQSGQNMSQNRLVLSDFKITSERAEICAGDTLELSYILTSEALYPMLISMPDGLYFSAIDPDGEDLKVGGAYMGEFLSSGESIVVRTRMVVDKTGKWTIWPSYNIQNNNGIVQYNPKQWQAAEIFIDEKYVPLPDLVIVEAGIAGSGQNGDEKRFYYIVENTGPVAAKATASGIFINEIDTGLENPVGMLPPGESQKAFFTLDEISRGDKVTIVLDAENLEEELDEENNDWSFVFNIKNDVSKAYVTDLSLEEKETYDQPSSIIYYPSAPAVCCDYTLQFIILGLLSVVTSAFSFALGYYYCHSKECENELGWMYAKLKRMDEEKNGIRHVRNYGSKTEREVRLKEDIPGAKELLKGNSVKKESGEEPNAESIPEEDKDKESSGQKPSGSEPAAPAAGESEGEETPAGAGDEREEEKKEEIKDKEETKEEKPPASGDEKQEKDPDKKQ